MYWFASANENGPGFHYGQLLVVHGAGDTIAQIAWDYFTNKMVFRTGNPPETGGSRTWNEWKQVSIATSPQEFDLPLANGIENGGNTSAYWKSQEGIVFVRFSVMKTGSHHQNNDVFATLPEGFRPKQRILFAGIGDLISAGTGVIAAEIAINTNGTMQLVYANSAPTWIMGEAVFIAAD